jgi:CDP-glycerol glycerophosphotransferase (TagB/SpsB family)
MGSYPEKNIVVAGQPRYDSIHSLKKHLNKIEISKQYNISENKKIILWTTQLHGFNDEENNRTLDCIFKTFRDLNNCLLIIKQHPDEGQFYTDLLEKYRKKYNVCCLIIPKKSDILEQIFICDLMITKTSTTALEAIALNKPVIILDLVGKANNVNYVDAGVAIGVLSCDTLKNAVEKLLKSDEELAKYRANYVSNYLYNLDGKSSERIVNTLIQLTKIEVN